MMLTSKRVAVGLALWWLLVLVAEVQSYILELRRGAYPVDADWSPEELGDAYRQSYAGKGRLVLKQVKGYFRTYAWS